LANDLLGFHLPSFADNFLRCAQRLEGVEVDWSEGKVTLGGHTCTVRAFPISIDVEACHRDATAPTADEQMRRLRERYAPAGEWVGIGVDRLDYSKGLPEKFKALEFLWDRYPEFRGKFT